jgi:hypothetical protein
VVAGANARPGRAKRSTIPAEIGRDRDLEHYALEGVTHDRRPLLQRVDDELGAAVTRANGDSHAAVNAKSTTVVGSRANGRQPVA